MSNKPKFIVIEGCDGCGKSEIIESLKKEYSKNKNIIFVKEPDFNQFGKDVQDLISNHNLSADIKLQLFMAARLELLRNTILPALEEGKVVISERFALSTWAYQCSEDDSLLNLMKSNLEYLSKLCKVDFTVFIRSTIKDIIGEEKEENIDDPAIINRKQVLGKLLLWYNLGLTCQEVPRQLIGETCIIDQKDMLKDKIKTIKKLINDEQTNSDG